MGIQRQRILNHLFELGNIGFEDGKGTSRKAYSDAYFRGRDYIEMLMKEAGLETYIDRVGNLCGRLAGKTDKIIAIGSHIDTVPNAGIYDGALGVISAIECLEYMQEEHYENNYTIEVIAFNEEEGNAVGGTFGSKCFTGVKVEQKEYYNLHKYNLNIDDVKDSMRNPKDYKAYLELHIEQGGVLESEKKQIGLVEGIVGIIRYKAIVLGESNHAGSTPMKLRNDAMRTSIRIIDDLMKMVESKNSTMVCTIGEFKICNPAVNVVPGKTEFLIEMRDNELTQMKEVINELSKKYSNEILELTQFIEQKETILDKNISNMAQEICEDMEVSYMRMFSGAGHDAINMQLFTPSFLMFIPSINGISHSIKEYSTPEDIEVGTKVLYKLLKKIDNN